MEQKELEALLMQEAQKVQNETQEFLAFKLNKLVNTLAGSLSPGDEEKKEET